MSINFVLCEDKQVILNSLKNNIEKIIKKYTIDADVSFVTSDPKEVLHYSSHRSNGINAYFLDINLGSNMNGLELARQIRKNDPHCYIVFETGHPELCMTAFKFHVEAFEYLVKPISYQALEECLLSIHKNYVNLLDHQKNDKNSVLTVRSGNCEYNIEIAEIIYIESMEQKLILHTENRKIEFFGYLKELVEELNRNEDIFLRCHRSYIINTRQISEVHYKGSYAIMSNGDKCFIARSQKAELKKIMSWKEKVNVSDL